MTVVLNIVRVILIGVAICSLVYGYGFPSGKGVLGIASFTGGYALAVNLFLGFFLYVYFLLFRNWAFQLGCRRAFLASHLLGGLFAIFLVVGHRFSIAGSLIYFLYPLSELGIFFIQLLGFYVLFQQLLSLIYYFFDFGDRTNCQYGLAYGSLFRRNIFAISFLILLGFWSPYVVGFYPGILAVDPVAQIRQYFGEFTQVASLTNLIDQSSPQSNTHPYFHTFLLGMGVQVGKSLGSVSLGVFFSSMLQVVFCAFAFAFAVYYFSRMGVPSVYLVILLCIYALVPVYPFYLMTPIKDTLFTIFFILFTLYFIILVKGKGRGISWGMFTTGFFLSMLLCLIRHNGVYIVVGTWAFYAICVRTRPLPTLSMLGLVILSFYSYNHFLLPSIKVSPSSVRTSLWVPLQQTARVAKYYPHEFSKEDFEAISGVLEIVSVEELGDAYRPTKSDSVADLFKKEATSDQVFSYLKSWAFGFLKTPGVYLAALVHKSYGYFYPLEVKWTVYEKPSKMAVKHGLGYQVPDLKKLRDFLIGWEGLVTYAPAVSLLSNIGFSSWVVFVVLSIWWIRRDYLGMVVLVPSLVLCITLLGTPWNGHFRYSLPLVAVVPLLLVYTRFFCRRS